MAERWRPVKGYEGKYIVSDKGNVMSVPRTYTDRLGRDYVVDGITLIKCDNGRGYDRVRLGKHTAKKIHRIVAEAFIPNPLNLPEVNHKDGNKKNNCVENLEWVTHQENMIHAAETGLFGEWAKKATPEIVAAIQAEYVPHSREHGTMALGKKYGIDPAYVWRIINGQRRKRLPITDEAVQMVMRRLEALHGET